MWLTARQRSSVEHALVLEQRNEKALKQLLEQWREDAKTDLNKAKLWRGVWIIAALVFGFVAVSWVLAAGRWLPFV